jgi:hypothetical protein
MDRGYRTCGCGHPNCLHPLDLKPRPEPGELPDVKDARCARSTRCTYVGLHRRLRRRAFADHHRGYRQHRTPNWLIGERRHKCPWWWSMKEQGLSHRSSRTNAPTCRACTTCNFYRRKFPRSRGVVMRLGIERMETTRAAQVWGCHDRASEGSRAVGVVAMARDDRGEDWNQWDTKWNKCFDVECPTGSPLYLYQMNLYCCTIRIQSRSDMLQLI